MLMRELRQIDLTIYVQALQTYATNPIIALAPLVAGLIDIPVRTLGSGTEGTTGMITSLIDLYGLALAVVAADYAWRYKHARFDQAYADARRKMSDILMASLGVLFVMFIPSLFGMILGSLALLLEAVAAAFVLYAIPAVAIGGVPGAAALQISVDRVRAYPATTAILFLVCCAAYACATLSAQSVLSTLGVQGSPAFGLLALILPTFTRALSLGYIATALAKVYSNISYARRF